MVVLASGPLFGAYDPNITDSVGGIGLIAAVNNADPEASNRFAPRPITFTWDGTCLGDEALTVAAAVPINLTGLGVTFPVGTMRNIRVRCWSKRAAATNAGYTEKIYTVQGGAPPTLPALVTLAGSLDNGANDNRALIQINNLNSAPGAPQYAAGVLALDGTNVVCGVQNYLGSTAAVTATPGIRVRLEVLVDPLVILAVFA
jgi:hypothetical protein